MATDKLRQLVMLRTKLLEESFQIIKSGTRESPEHQRQFIEAFKQWRDFDRKMWRKAGCIKRWRYRTFYNNASVPIVYEGQNGSSSEHGEEEVLVPPSDMRLVEYVFTTPAPSGVGSSEDQYLINRRMFKLKFLNGLQGVHPKNCRTYIRARFVDPKTLHQVIMFSVYRANRVHR